MLRQTTALREGKDAGDYHAWDIDTELEYGITDKFQIGVGIRQHIFDNHGVEGLREVDGKSAVLP